MRILFLSIEFSLATFSGNGVYAQSQVRALIKLGHEVLTICGCPKGALEGSPAPNVLPIPIPVWGRLDAACSWKEFADGCCTPQIVRRVHEFDPEVVIGIDWHSVTVYHYLTATLASVGHRRPLAYIYSNYRVYLRSVDSEIKGEKDLIAELEGQALALSACSTVLSRSDLEFVQQQYATALAGVQRPIHVLLPALRSDMASIPPPPSFTNCATPAEHWQHRMYLTCCVRASPEKEPHRFVEAVCELEKRGVFDALGIVPLVAGAGWADGTGGDYAQRLRQWLRGQVPQCVIVDSFLSPDELADIYARTALNVHPPAYDAYGMTVVEAASQGAPTLLNGGGHVGASDLLPSASGLSFETDIVGPASQLADTIEALLRDTDALRHVGSAAMAVARQWSEEANARQLIEYVQAALGSKPPKTDELLPEQAKPRAGAPCSGPKGSESGAQLQRGGIDVVQAAALTYDEFEQRYLARNRPVILQGVTDHWKAARDWVLPGGEVNIHFLDEEFGAAAVSVTDCSRYGDSNEPSCHAMTVSQYCAWWRGHHAKGDSAAASCQSISSSVRDSEPRPPHGSQDGTSQGLLYLKDWHFALDFPGYQAYTCPPFFQDDWLNDWYDAQHAKRTPSAGDVASDYRFVYLGPAGTKTPLHADVLRSHSWSANVAGRKLWRLLPAEFGHLVYHANGRTTASDFFLAAESAENGSAGGFNPYPGLAQAQEHVLEVEQLPGEAIFVPSGWFHTVTNLEDCCSINHNWISSHSLGSTWAHVCTERAQAADLIADCRVGCSPAEFESLVQRNVRINCSLDYAGVGALIRDIATAAAVCVLEPGSVGEEKEEEAEVGRHAPRAVARLNAAVDVLEAMLREERPMAVEESDGRTARETGACGAGEGAGKVAEWCRAGTEVAANEACLKLIHQALAAHRALQRT